MALYGKSGSGYYKTTDYRDNKIGTNSHDYFFGYGGNDIFNGRDGNDKIYGDSGNDVFDGGNGNDKISGGSGNDYLYGHDGSDTLEGGSGDDTLIGGFGFDTLEGGSGKDNFYFRNRFEGVDTITDFRWQDDKIMISKSGFGATSTNQFKYNSSTGELSFNQVPFAKLSNKPNFIASADIKLIS